MLRPLLLIALPTTLAPCTTSLVPPRAVIDVACAGQRCEVVELSSARSTGLNLTLEWTLPDGTKSTQPTLLVERPTLQLGPVRLRVASRAGVAWAELHDVDDIDAIIDLPDPVSPFVVLESGSCQFGSVALDLPGADAPVGGCVSDADAIGMRWRTTPLSGPSRDHGAYLHVATDTPYIYEQRPLAAPNYVPYFTVAPLIPSTPQAVYTARRVSTPLEQSTPLPAVFPTVPAPLHNVFSPPDAYFSVWQILAPGETMVAQWVQLDTLSGFHPNLSYFGADVTPKTRRFQISCPASIQTTKATLTDPNLPLFRLVPDGLDLDGDGVPTPADCDDFERLRTPGRPDQPYDGWDADCSGSDFDFDGDGAGAQQGGGTDCDDNDPAVFPGAPELPNHVDDDCDDLLDESCPNDSYERAVPWDHPTVQAALNNANPGDRICVEPGVWTGPVTVPALPLHLFGASAAAVIDAQQAGAALTIAAGARPDTVVSGLTLTGGLSAHGGGVHALPGSPTLRDLQIVGNEAERGGGLWLSPGTATLQVSGLWVSDNTAGASGGGLHLTGGALDLSSSSFTDNHTLSGPGGAVHAEQSGALTLTRVELWSNTATRGAGLSLAGVGPTTISELTAVDNLATDEGGALAWLATGPLSLTYATLLANEASHGAGAWFNTHPTFNCDLLPRPTLRNSLVIGQRTTDPQGAAGLAVGAPGSSVQDGVACLAVSGLDLWSPLPSLLLHAPELGDPFAAGLIVSLDPMLQTWSPDLDPALFLPHLRDASPLRTTHGAGQGPHATPGWYDDLDQDGLLDGWERLVGLDPTTPDATTDPDLDGLSNDAEQLAGTWPTLPDTDSDGVIDGVELGSGTDPLDPGDF
jgi:hypothetical protein